jgi:hypothetical protein
MDTGESTYGGCQQFMGSKPRGGGLCLQYYVLGNGECSSFGPCIEIEIGDEEPLLLSLSSESELVVEFGGLYSFIQPCSRSEASSAGVLAPG